MADYSTPPPPSGPDYSGYYARPGQGSHYGSAEKIRALYDGYNGLSVVFLINVILAVGSNFALGSPTSPDAALVTFGVLILGLGLLVGFLTYPQNRKIGFGCGWAPSQAILASVLMGINSALCCGIIGYVVLQGIAVKEMKKYGLKTGFLGFKKKDVIAKIQEMEAMPRQVPQ